MLRRLQSWEDVEGDAETIEPFSLVAEEVSIVGERLRNSVLSSVPALRQAAEYFFRSGVEGKRLRPTLALLMASALSSQAPSRDFLKVGRWHAAGARCTVHAGGALGRSPAACAWPDGRAHSSRVSLPGRVFCV